MFNVSDSIVNENNKKLDIRLQEISVELNNFKDSLQSALLSSAKGD